ncbi:MAG TPA: F0F1 ATP synthase subunit gamma [Bacteroidia bacterium]|nr:F0F1 ATP synthase subunit gamma [Bacteroidia bacterium]
MDTLESLRRKIGSAGELESVVRTMKAMAASGIGQYERAVAALRDYYRTVELGMIAYFRQEIHATAAGEKKKEKQKRVFAIVFGSDQGLVGQFNETMAEFVSAKLQSSGKITEIWTIGERVNDRLTDAGFPPVKTFPVPNSLGGITSLVGKILAEMEEVTGNESNEVFIFHNKPRERAGYEPSGNRLFPPDEKWKNEAEEKKWPANKQPQVVGGQEHTLAALVREYLFVSVYRACAESLACENAGRLEAMQRAEKNIDELMEELNHKYHRLRQSSIDEELFDVVSGFEALKKNRTANSKRGYY